MEYGEKKKGNPHGKGKGMAITIIGGLTFATVLTLIAVPVIYAIFFGIRPADEVKVIKNMSEAPAA